MGFARWSWRVERVVIIGTFYSWPSFARCVVDKASLQPWQNGDLTPNVALAEEMAMAMAGKGEHELPAWPG